MYWLENWLYNDSRILIYEHKVFYRIEHSSFLLGVRVLVLLSCHQSSGMLIFVILEQKKVAAAQKRELYFGMWFSVDFFPPKSLLIFCLPNVKYGLIPASFCLFLFFSNSNNNFNNTNWKKCRWCAWDLNPGPQDGRRRRNHGACLPNVSLNKKVASKFHWTASWPAWSHQWGYAWF